LNFIPYASLAAILFVVGFKLAKPSVMRAMYNKGWVQFVPFAITIIGIVGIDLLWGIGLGLAVAILQILWNNFKTPYHFNPDEYKKGETVKIMLAEEVTFLNKAGIMNTLNNMPDGISVIIDGSQVQYIHDDVLEIIDEFMVNAKTRDINARFEGYHPENDTTTKKRVGELEKSILNLVSKKIK
jgi:MFS superfamily sulfate permease-like transporter